MLGKDHIGNTAQVHNPVVIGIAVAQLRQVLVSPEIETGTFDIQFLAYWVEVVQPRLVHGDVQSLPPRGGVRHVFHARLADIAHIHALVQVAGYIVANHDHMQVYILIDGIHASQAGEGIRHGNHFHELSYRIESAGKPAFQLFHRHDPGIFGSPSFTGMIRNRVVLVVDAGNAQQPCHA